MPATLLVATLCFATIAAPDAAETLGATQRAADDVDLARVALANHAPRVADRRLVAALADLAAIEGSSTADTLRARLVGVRVELRRGHGAKAAQLLRVAAPLVTRVQVEAPLVPIRAALDRAARAADRGDWAASAALVSDAEGQLRDLRAVEPALADSLDPLVADAAAARAQIQSGERPAPQRLRHLAARTGSLRVE